MDDLIKQRKNLIVIKSWEELYSRPKYKAPIDPKKTKLIDIIGDYRNYPRRPCGLSSCRTPHNHGYLVICGGDIETNLGNTCGENKFPDFVKYRKSFRQEKNAQRHLEKIIKLRKDLPEMEKKIKHLYFKSMVENGCYEMMKWHDLKGHEGDVIKALRQMAKNKDNIIRRQISLDSQEREIAKETGNNSTFRLEDVAKIYGISAIIDYKKLKRLFNITLGKKIETLKTIDLSSATHKELKKWFNYANEIEINIAKAETIIDDCHRFLVQENLDTISRFKHHL